MLPNKTLNRGVVIGGQRNTRSKFIPGTKFHVVGDAAISGSVTIQDGKSHANSTLYASTSTNTQPILNVVSDVDVKGLSLIHI